MKEIERMRFVTILLFIFLVGAAGAQDEWRALLVQPKQVQVERETRRFDTEVQQIKGQGKLSAIYFVDAQKGFVGGDGGLHQTTDGGKTWRPVAFKLPTGSRVTRIDFPSASIGWVVAELANDGFNPAGSASIYRTVDAGSNWTLVREEKGVVITDSYSEGASSYWVIGTRTNTASLLDDEPFLLTTSDAGGTWQNERQVGLTTPPDSSEAKGFVSLIRSGGVPVGIVTSEKRLILFPAGGEAGLRNASLKEAVTAHSFAPKSAGLSDEKKLWILSGFRSSKEGVSSGFYQEQVDGIVVRNDLAGPLYLVDAVFTGSAGLFACGSSGTARASNGVILHSAGPLSTWTIIFRTTETDHLSAIVEASPNIWAVSDKGKVVKISRK